MKTSNIRELRHDTNRVLGWVAQGQQVQLTRYGEVVAVISPPDSSTPRPTHVDYAARLRAIWGDRVPSSSAREIQDYDRGER